MSNEHPSDEDSPEERAAQIKHFYDFNESLKDPVKFDADLREAYRKRANDNSGKYSREERELARQAAETPIPVEKVIAIARAREKSPAGKSRRGDSVGQQHTPCGWGCGRRAGICQSHIAPCS